MDYRLEIIEAGHQYLVWTAGGVWVAPVGAHPTVLEFWGELNYQHLSSRSFVVTQKKAHGISPAGL